jgi:hemoglobin/transferrin/lactoferrin receptor protein
MKQLFIGCLFVCLSFSGLTQVITIRDQESGDPIFGAKIMNENGIFAVTNPDGQFNLDPFKESKKIEVRAEGYSALIKTYEELSTGDLLLSPTVIELEDIVVSVTRWEQKSSSVPSHIRTVSAKDIALQNPQTAADLLSISGQVFIQKSQQGGGSPMIRGFATNRLLYTVDGVRMNTAIFRGGNIQNVISLDPFAIEKAEVVFGPGSVIYGSDAIGGVMSFQSLTPSLSLKSTPLISGKAIARYATANKEKTAHFDINVGWQKWALLTSFSSNDFEDLKMGTYGPDEYLRPFYVERIDSNDVIVHNKDPKVQAPSGYSQMNLMQKVRFSPNEHWDFNYGFHYSETSDYARYDRHIRYKNGLPRYGEWSYGPQKWMMNYLSAVQHKKTVMHDEFSVRLAQQSFEESRISRDIQKTTREIRVEHVEAYSINVDLVKHLGMKHTIYYGIEGVWNKVESQGTDEDIETGERVPGPARYPQALWASYGAYLNHQWKPSEIFMLQTGLRYSYFSIDADFDTTFYPFPFTSSETKNGGLTGSLGFVLRPTDSWVISMNLGTAYRAPNVDDIGKVFDSEPGTVTVPNPALNSEYAYNADLSVAKVFGRWLRVDASGYYTYLQNAMVRRNFTLNGTDSILYDGELSQVQAIQNAAFATVFGVQCGLEINLSHGFSLSSDVNFQQGVEELEDGTQSPSRHAPPWFGRTRLRYTQGRLSMEFSANYSGERSFDQLAEEERNKPEIYAQDHNGNPWSPDWYTLNFKANYNFERNFGVSAGIENITDQRYRTYSSGIAAAGRNFYLALRCTF